MHLVAAGCEAFFVVATVPLALTPHPHLVASRAVPDYESGDFGMQRDGEPWKAFMAR